MSFHGSDDQIGQEIDQAFDNMVTPVDHLVGFNDLDEQVLAIHGAIEETLDNKNLSDTKSTQVVARGIFDVSKFDELGAQDEERDKLEILNVIKEISKRRSNYDDLFESGKIKNIQNPQEELEFVRKSKFLILDLMGKSVEFKKRIFEKFQIHEYKDIYSGEAILIKEAKDDELNAILTLQFINPLNGWEKIFQKIVLDRQQEKAA